MIGASGRSRWCTTTRAIAATDLAGAYHRRTPTPCGATPTCCRPTPQGAGGPGSRVHPTRPGRPAGGRARPGELWIKNDTLNPTGSFKDRVVSVALTKARELGFKVAACASTGNLANSVAAHAARAGMRSVVFIPSDLEPAKIVATAVFGGHVVAVDGNYDDVNRLCAELAGDTRLGVRQRQHPYLLRRGSKTLAFEVAEQLGWRTPDHVVVPIGSGSQLPRWPRASPSWPRWACSTRRRRYGSPVPRPRDARRWRRRSPRGRTSCGRSPVDDRQVAGHRQSRRRRLRPRGGARSRRGHRSVTDEEIVEGIRLLARTEGIFAETAGGVTIATLRQARRLRHGPAPTSGSWRT